MRVRSHLKATSRNLLVAFIVLVFHFALLFMEARAPRKNQLLPSVVMVTPVVAIATQDPHAAVSSSRASFESNRKHGEFVSPHSAFQVRQQPERRPSPVSSSAPKHDMAAALSDDGQSLSPKSPLAVDSDQALSAGNVVKGGGESLHLRVMVAKIQGAQTELGEGLLVLERDGGTGYRSELSWKMPGMFQPHHRLVSEGLIAEQLNPSRYTNSISSEIVDVAPGWLDPLALVWQLRAMLQNTPDLDKLPLDHLWTFAVQDGTAQQQWQWQLHHGDYLRLPGQPVRAVRLSSENNGADLRRVDLWFAPDRDWLPVRIKFTQSSGVVLDVMWQETLL